MALEYNGEHWVDGCGCRYADAGGLVIACDRHSPYQIPGLKAERDRYLRALEQIREREKEQPKPDNEFMRGLAQGWAEAAHIAGAALRWKKEGPEKYECEECAAYPRNSAEHYPHCSQYQRHDKKRRPSGEGVE